jgi:sulfite exporter TauE/SafE
MDMPSPMDEKVRVSDVVRGRELAAAQGRTAAYGVAGLAAGVTGAVLLAGITSRDMGSAAAGAILMLPAIGLLARAKIRYAREERERRSRERAATEALLAHSLTDAEGRPIIEEGAIGFGIPFE